MLKLKSPIKLHTTQSLRTSTDSFGERIRGNYSLLGAHFAPKDLLFLLTAPVEIPEDLGGMTTLVTQQNNVDVTSVTLDVVNNVVNRILLDGTETFTYQDRVYITSVLKRLGITNTEQFMSQVRRLKVENENAVHMTNLYREEIKNILQRVENNENILPIPAVNVSSKADDETYPEDPRVTMCMNILERLGTSKIYETVHSFQQNQMFSDNYITKNEMRLSEQLRFKNSVNLAQIKKQVMSYPQINLAHHINQYETDVILETPESEEAVLAQAAVAALVNTIDNTVTEVLNRPSIKNETWMNITNAIRQSAENTISRFERYHNETRTVPTREIHIGEAWERFAIDIREYKNFFNYLYPEKKSDKDMVRMSGKEKTVLTHVVKEEDADIYESNEINNYTKENILSILRRETAKFENEAKKQGVYVDAVATEIKKQTEKATTDLTYLTNINEETELLNEYTDRKTIEEVRPEIIREIERRENKEAPRHSTSTVYRDEVMHEVESQKMESSEKFSETEFYEKTVLKEHEEIFRQITQLHENERVQENEFIPISLTPVQAEEEAPEILEHELLKFDEQNKTTMKMLREEMLLREPAMNPIPDTSRTMREALKALDEPEMMVREIYSSKEEVRTVHPEFTPEEEAVLNRADPATRAIYEQIIRYQKSPESVRTDILRPGNIGELRADLKKASENGTAELEYLQNLSETERITEETENVIEKIIQSSKSVKNHEKPRSPHRAIEIVHKQAPPDITEEIMEKLEERRLQQNFISETNETVNSEKAHTVDVRQIEKKVITRTDEDITELVNRTLAKQMRTISDQVYRQMEKRLQTERSRRGRI